jgi:hypothetical protein
MIIFPRHSREFNHRAVNFRLNVTKMKVRLASGTLPAFDLVKKPYLMSQKSKSFVAFIILAAAFSARAYAVTPNVTPLLIIDDSDPSAVTITATDYNPFRSDTSHDFADGIDLLNLFAPNSIGTDYFGTSGTLTTFIDGEPDFNDSHSDDVTGDYQDLNLYFLGDSGSNTENFSTSSQAFTGTTTVDLSDEAANLLPAGTIGAIYAGYSGDLGSSLSEGAISTADVFGGTYIMYLGDYEIVPEPGQGALLLLGAAGLLAFYRFRASRASA